MDNEENSMNKPNIEYCIYPSHMINFINEKEHKWFEKPKLAWWETSGQEWLYIGATEGTSVFGQTSRVCERAPFSYGEKIRSLSTTDRDRSSHKWSEARQSHQQFSTAQEWVGSLQAGKEIRNL